MCRRDCVGMKTILLSVACFLTTAWVPECDPDGCGPSMPVSLGRVSVTSFQAVEGQTDRTPFITADGTDLRETDEQICAVSQDMLWFKGGPIRWGDLLWLYIPHYPEGPVVQCVVSDTMAATIFRNGKEVPLMQHVDLLSNIYDKWTGRALLIKGDAHADHVVKEIVCVEMGVRGMHEKER